MAKWIRSLPWPARVALLAVPVGAVLLAGCSGAERSATRRTVPAATVVQPAPPVAPLTGMPVTAPIDRPALSIKVDNSPPGLPQSGLNQADIVTDALVEGGLTRLMATYQAQDAPQVGPIRSARPVDAALLRELGGGIFAYSGAAAGEIAPVKADSTATLLSFDNGISAFKQLPGHPVPYQVYASTQDLYVAGQQAGAASAPPPELFTYSAEPPPGPPAAHVTIPMSSVSSAAWTWDPPSQTYLRTQDGQPDSLADGSRISATNVVILSVAIGPTGIFDSAGHQDPLVIVTGSGPAWVLRNGELISGTWQRPSITDTVRLLDSSGARIPLQPGRTWLELLPQPGQPSFP